MKHASDARLRAEKRATKHRTHWIGGKPWDGEAERRGGVGVSFTTVECQR
jgi:hypothetical protein